jgi:phenylalanyl-tRNA synthetase alpha chain
VSEILELIKKLDSDFQKDISDCRDERALEEVRIKYLGRNGILNTHLLKKISSFPPEERRSVGQEANNIKNRMENVLEEKVTVFRMASAKEVKCDIDLTIPGRRPSFGSLHPLTITANRIRDIFKDLGFSIAEGPDIETEYYNFDALNFPSDHPAKDMHDTFYLTDGRLMRTHTSPVQIRVMEKVKPPIRMIMPGKVYRKDADVSHSVMFHQVEGLVVGKDVNFSHLKYILHEFARAIFNKDAQVRFRPSYFPFTEPSAEVDISCVICKGKGCRVCKNSGWLEILGAGMVDPNVFKSVNIDPEIYSGYAFGMGVERIAMLLFSIDDIRLFFENNLEFIKQF